MIRASRLFFIPATSAFFVLIPIVGVFVWFFIIIYWYDKNNLEICRFFRGQNYLQNEVTDDTLEKFK